ncbi:MAG: M1 family metallopeptidase, partial [Acidobacteriota bacterium]
EEALTGDLKPDVRREDWGWIQVDRIRALGAPEAVDLTTDARHVAPDDGNEHDRTVLAVPLPRPVGPGETIEVEMEWRAKVPRTFARTGYRGDYFFIAHWFPKLGVFEGADGWSCHQYHSNTEYYSDYGVYRVDLTVPEGFVVGATGRETAREAAGEGLVTHRFVQADVHAFTWTASPDYLEATDRFRVDGLPPVDLRLLYQPEHSGQVERHFAATKAALELYGTWYGPYPYGHLTVVDPAWGSRTGGMEYPTLFTAGSRLLNPFGGGSPEGVTIHEAGHQFWYGIVGNDELEHAWLDEGLNTYSTGRVEQERYGDEALVERYLRPPGTDLDGFLPVLFPGIREGPLVGRLDRYRRHADWDVPATPTFRYYPGSHGDMSYSKTALWLATLERHLGWETLREILSTFFTRYSFRHPEPEDFFAVADEVAAARFGPESGPRADPWKGDLEWFFDQVHRSSVTFDVELLRATTTEVEPDGFVERDGEMVYVGGEDGDDHEPAAYRSEVVVRRNGQGFFPVDVLLVFEDGSEVRERWEADERWRLFVHEGPSKLVRAEVDPERVLRLDLHPTNNGMVVGDGGSRDADRAAVEWASRWMIWLQDLLQTFATFV